MSSSIAVGSSSSTTNTVGSSTNTIESCPTNIQNIQSKTAQDWKNASRRTRKRWKQRLAEHEKQQTEIAHIRDSIKKQSLYVRKMKATGVDKQQFLKEVESLLDLKFLDPDNDEVKPPKTIKIRWKLSFTTRNKQATTNNDAAASSSTTSSETTKESVTLQFPFHNRTFVRSDEVLSTIVERSRHFFSLGSTKARMHPDDIKAKLGDRSVLKAFVMLDHGNKFVAITPDYLFRLRVVNPGPTYEDDRVFSIRVVWNDSIALHEKEAKAKVVGNKRPLIASPAAYAQFAQLPELIDAGVNFCNRYLKGCVPSVINEALAVGVTQHVLLSTNAKNSSFNVELAQRNVNTLFPVVGVHPCDALLTPISDLTTIKGICESHDVVAIGEIGLDYSYRPSAKTIAKLDRPEIQSQIGASSSSTAALDPAQEQPHAQDQPQVQDPAAELGNDNNDDGNNDDNNDDDNNDDNNNDNNNNNDDNNDDNNDNNNNNNGDNDNDDDNQGKNSSSKFDQDNNPEYIKILELYKKKQRQWFAKQLKLATQLKLPVVLHVRDAHDDFMKILKKHVSGLTKLVINCFSGNKQQLQEYLALGASIIITGLIGSDKRGSEVRKLLPLIPKDRLMLATDAPHLVPFNMPKPYPSCNRPATLPYILTMVAAVCDQDVHALAKQTTENTRRFFSLPAPFFDGHRQSANAAHAFAASSSAASSSPIDFSALDKKLASVELPKESLPQLKKGQQYFAHDGKTYVVTAEKKKLLEKQKSILPADAFNMLVQDIIKL